MLVYHTALINFVMSSLHAAYFNASYVPTSLYHLIFFFVSIFMQAHVHKENHGNKILQDFTKFFIIFQA